MDDNEVSQVRLVIKSRDTGSYWNGHLMVDDWNYHFATLLDDGRWEFDLDLAPGRYLVSARGIDEHSNFASTVVKQLFIVE